MPLDNIRNVGSYTSSDANEVFQVELPTDSLCKQIYLDIKINLATGTTAGTVPRDDGIMSIIRNLKLDLDGKSRYESSGAVRQYLEKYYFNSGNLYEDTLVAPGSGLTSTIQAILPINFALPYSKVPNMGFLPLHNYKNAFINFTLGNIGNLFGTISDTSITSVVIDVYVKEILGVSGRGRSGIADIFIEPVTLIESVSTSNSELEIKMPKGDRDYLCLLLRTESATDVLSDSIISGEFKIEGSGPEIGTFYNRKMKTLKFLQMLNQMEFNGLPPRTGYALIDFIGNGDIRKNAIGTDHLSAFKFVCDATGGTSNKIGLTALVAKK